MHQHPRPGDILLSDAPTLVGKAIMAGTDSGYGHVGVVVAVAEDGSYTTHEGFPSRRRSLDGIVERHRPAGDRHLSFVTVAHTPCEVAIMLAWSYVVVHQNRGYAWGEIARIAAWSVASWLRVLRLAKPASLLERAAEWAANRWEDPQRRICSNHVATLLHHLWVHRARSGDPIAQWMLDSTQLPPERQDPGYVSKRLSLSLRLYQEAGVTP